MDLTKLLDEIEQEDLEQADTKRRQYEAVLLRHPNCRDPDHPGCDKCENEAREIGEDDGD